MKFIIASIILIGATLAQGAAVAGPENHIHGAIGRCGVRGQSCKRGANAGSAGFCGLPGEACSRAKRSALALADAFAEADPSSVGFCGAPGQLCEKARRSIQEVGEIAERTYHAVQAREAQYIYIGRCGVRGEDCKGDAEALAKKVARHAARSGRCGHKGQSCKRNAAAAAKAVAKAEATLDRTGRCGRKGQSCKRNAAAAAAAAAAAEAEAEAAASVRGQLGRCGRKGQSCKRNAAAAAKAEAKAEATLGRTGRCGRKGQSCKRSAEDEALYARDNDEQTGFCGESEKACDETRRDVEARHGGFIGRCGRPGQSCKRTPNAETIALIARNITDLNPNYFDTDCETYGGECSALRRAHSAFHRIKREAEAAQHTADLEARAAFCDNHDCTFATRRWIEDAANEVRDALEERDACFDLDGDCAIAKRALDELEETLNAAVAAL